MTRPLSPDAGFQCDWGGCDDSAVAERRDGAVWLPVCTGHGDVKPARSAVRGICSVCSLERKLTKAGVVVLHREPKIRQRDGKQVGVTVLHCSGSWKLPLITPIM